jgi:hypothetical protein
MRDPRNALYLAAFGPLLAACPGVATPYTIPKLTVLALGAALAATLALRGENGPDAAGTSILPPLGACLAALAAAAFFSKDPSASLFGAYFERGFGLLTLATCAVVTALAQASGPSAGRGAAYAAAGAGGVLSAFALLQLFGLDPVLNAISQISYGRAGSLVGSPHALGTALAALLPLQLRLALDGDGPVEKRSGWSLLALTAAGIVSTWSRGGWLSAAIGVGCYLLWTKRLANRRRVTAIAAAGAVGALALAFAAGISRPTRASDSGRLAVWETSWAMFADNPLLGVGPDAFSVSLGGYKTESFVGAYGDSVRQAHAHNDFLQVLSSSGLIGFGAYLWLLVAAWRRLRRALEDDALRASSAAAGAGLAAVFVAAKFNPVNIDGLALCALLLGLLDPRGSLPRVPRAAAAVFAVAALAASAWLFHADRLCLAGMRAQNAGDIARARASYRDAVRANPTEFIYRYWLVGLLRAQARGESDPARRRTLHEEALSSARAMARIFPNDARSQHALGGALAALTLDGGPNGLAEAAVVLDRGLRNDWSYRALLKTRLAVAQLRKDAATRADSTERLSRLDALSPRRP